MGCCFDSDVLYIAESQGDVFQFAQEAHCDMYEFAKKYMKSDFCNREMDSVYSYYHFKPTYVFEAVFNEEKLEHVENGHEFADPRWVGMAYRLIANYLGKPSAEVISRVPVEEMEENAAAYEGWEWENVVKEMARKYFG